MIERNVLSLDKNEIMNIIPHRGSSLLVDTAEITLENGTATFCASTFQPKATWETFQNHFPESPVMPGIFITEAMAQCADILILFNCSENYLPLLASIQNMRFFRPVVPEDILRCEAIIKSHNENLYECSVTAFVQDKKIAQGQLTLCLK